MTTSGIVHSNPESIIEWWFHPNQLEEFRNYFEKTGASNLTTSEAVTGGIRLRSARYTDRNGWEHEHHVEIQVVPDRIGGRFVAPGTDQVILRSPSGREMSVKCHGRLEFVPDGKDNTEVRSVHDHVLQGGTWRERWSVRRRDPIAQRQAFRDILDRCERDLNS